MHIEADDRKATMMPRTDDVYVPGFNDSFFKCQRERHTTNREYDTEVRIKANVEKMMGKVREFEYYIKLYIFMYGVLVVSRIKK